MVGVVLASTPTRRTVQVSASVGGLRWEEQCLKRVFTRRLPLSCRNPLWSLVIPANLSCVCHRQGHQADSLQSLLGPRWLQLFPHLCLITIIILLHNLSTQPTVRVDQLLFPCTNLVLKRLSLWPTLRRLRLMLSTRRSRSRNNRFITKFLYLPAVLCIHLMRLAILLYPPIRLCRIFRNVLSMLNRSSHTTIPNNKHSTHRVTLLGTCITQHLGLSFHHLTVLARAQDPLLLLSRHLLDNKCHI